MQAHDTAPAAGPPQIDQRNAMRRGRFKRQLGVEPFSARWWLVPATLAGAVWAGVMWAQPTAAPRPPASTATAPLPTPAMAVVPAPDSAIDNRSLQEPTPTF